MLNFYNVGFKTGAKVLKNDYLILLLILTTFVISKLLLFFQPVISL